jgi:hypothetical protein
MSANGTSRTLGDVRLESAKWGKADTSQLANVVLVVLVGSAFNVEIHKNAVQGIDRHWLGFGHLHSLPLVCGITRSAALDVKSPPAV